MADELNTYRRGDRRPDGFLFTHYSKRGGKLTPVWQSPAGFARKAAATNAAGAKWRARNPRRLKNGELSQADLRAA